MGWDAQYHLVLQISDSFRTDYPSVLKCPVNPFTIYVWKFKTSRELRRLDRRGIALCSRIWQCTRSTQTPDLVSSGSVGPAARR